MSGDLLSGLRSLIRGLPGANLLLGDPGILPSCATDRLFCDHPSDSIFHGGNDHVTYLDLKNPQEVRAAAASGWSPGVLQPRAPVNVNSAPLAVIRAVLQGLRGGYLDPTAYSPGAVWNDSTDWGGSNIANVYGRGYDADRRAEISPALATFVASEIVARRDVRPFSSVWEFDRWIDGLDGPAFSGAAAVKAAQKRIIKVNANANSHLNAFNPDRCWDAGRFGDLSKADLLRWSTEFSFNSGGYFEIESVGRVLGTPGAGGAAPSMAEAKAFAVVKVYEVYRQSTQKQFADALGAGTDSIRLYPENLGSVGMEGAAEWDGAVALATVDDAPGWNPGTTRFRRNFRDSFGPDSEGTAEGFNSLICNLDAGDANDRGAQSELFPDGVFCHETRRYPEYEPRRLYGYSANDVPVDDFLRYNQAKQKLNLGNGGVGMWVKPTWESGDFHVGYYGSGHQCGVDPPPPGDSSSTHNHPEGESTKCFFSTGRGAEHGAGHCGASTRVALGARQIVNSAGHIYVPPSMRGLYIVGFRGDSTVIWTGSPPAGKLLWNDMVPHWGWVVHCAYSIDTASADAQDKTYPYSWNFAGQWHYVCLTWSGNTTKLLVDGKTHNSYAQISASTSGNLNGGDSLFIGNNRFGKRDGAGFPCNADATLDAVSVFQTAADAPPQGNPPHRYLPAGVFVASLIDAQAAGQNRGGRVASVAWTAYFPDFAHGTYDNASMFLEIKSPSRSTGIISGGSTNALTIEEVEGIEPNAAMVGDGVALGMPLNVGETLDYEIQFLQDSQWYVGTPMLDDITVTVVPSSPTFLHYYFE